MAKETRKKRIVNKKYQARVDREKRQSQLIMIISMVVLGAVVIVVGYGILDQYVLQGIRPVATVNGDKVSTNEFQSLARYTRYSLIRNALNSYQFAQMFGSDPNTQGQFASQVQEIMRQMDVAAVGEQTVNQLVNDRLIRQEAAKMGITVSKEELDKAVAQAFGYFADGTPTPSPTVDMLPTSTLSSQQLTLIPPTATATITPTLTATATPSQTVTLAPPTATSEPTATLAPTATLDPTPEATATASATPTAYTEDAYKELYAETVKNFADEYQIPEETIRFVIESQLYREKLVEEIAGDKPCTQEQVWVMHILVADEEQAKDILKRLDEGEEWGALASELSTDTSNKDKGGDLGWFGSGMMVPEFEEAAYALEVGQTSDPVETQFGFHILRLLGREDRPLDAQTCEQMRQQEFSDWLDALREDSEIEINDDWYAATPLDPEMPPELIQWVSEVLSSQQGGGLPIQPQP